MITRVKNRSEIAAMRTGGQMLATVLDYLADRISVGMTTKDIAELAGSELAKLGGQPSFLNYQGFPDVICVSLNDEVVHGIPKANRVIKNGDIVSLDFGVTFKGLITDGAISLIAGQPISQAEVALLADTKEALEVAIKATRDNVRSGDIGAAVEEFLSKKPYGIIRDLVGHGVGDDVHEDPNIPNYGRRGTGPWLNKGMTVALEPMVTLGSHHIVIEPDGWTVRTADGSRAAHFEHTVLITAAGAEVLTTV